MILQAWEYVYGDEQRDPVQNINSQTRSRANMVEEDNSDSSESLEDEGEEVVEDSTK